MNLTPTLDFKQLDFAYWALQSVAMLITAILIPRLRITSIFGATGMVIALALVNAKLWDAALFLQIPNQFTYQAGLLLFSNGVIFWVLVKLLPGIEIDGFLPALAAPLVFTVSSLVIAQYAPMVDWEKLIHSGGDFIASVKTEVEKPSKPGSVHANK